MPQKGGSSIQGTVDDEITPEEILNIGKTVGMQYKNITVGRNLRPSSMMSYSALVSGLMSTGANIRDAGVLPSPILPFASHGTECCIMVGNPDSKDLISGISFYNTDGRFFNDPQMFTLKNRFKSDKILSNYKHVGNIKQYTGHIEAYKRKIMGISGKADCQVMLDCSSDCTIAVAPQVLNSFGADTVTVNCNIDWDATRPAPTLEDTNLRILSKVVKANYGSIGIAINGDGSRIVAIDEEGRYIDGTKLFALFVKKLQPKSFAMPVDTSMVVEDQTNGIAVMTRVGSGLIGEAVKSNDLGMGGCNDGSFVFPKVSYATDGIMAAVLLSEIATNSSLSDLIDELPTYYRNTDSVKYQEDREGIAKRISAKISDIGYKKLFEVDGWRMETDDGWFLIRFSDTEYTIDIIAEGRDKMYAAGLLEVAKEAVTSSLKR